MKYKVGDKVRIKSLDWYNMHCDDAGNVDCGCELFEKEMKPYLGKVFTIHRIVDNSKYEMEEAFDFFLFTDEMIEGLVEEEEIEFTEEDKYWCDIMSESDPTTYILPEGYIFKDENGNIINATKIVLEKKKKEYPKAYEECYEVMYGKKSPFHIPQVVKNIGYKGDLFTKLQRLIFYRDAYWKIAGEEMGLDKPWEPDWQKTEERKFCIIRRSDNVVTKWETKTTVRFLAFPTAEMRDAFYENFKKEIEMCKELL